jgi:hypothetical protein
MSPPIPKPSAPRSAVLIVFFSFIIIFRYLELHYCETMFCWFVFIVHFLGNYSICLQTMVISTNERLVSLLVDLHSMVVLYLLNER